MEGRLSSTSRNQTDFLRWFLWLEKVPNFPRNLSPPFLQYRSERPQMVSHDKELKKAKNKNGEIDHYVY
jgi:hypothetical protein